MIAAPVRHVFESRGALAAALAQAVAGVLSKAIARRGEGFLAVSGGTTPGLFFAALSDQPIDWEKVTVTLVDERFVPPSSGRSNAGLVTSTLLRGRAQAARFVPLYAEAGSVEEAAALTAGALAGLPWPLDATVLGMGTDGHTASFFPDATNLPALLAPQVPRAILPVHADSAGEPRLTLTLARLVDTGFLALHVEGAEKKAVLDRALDGASALPIRAVFDAAKGPVEVYWAA